MRGILLLLLLSLLSCQRIPKNIAEADFEKDQPEYTVKVEHKAVNKK